jgi:hypothetical protein
VALYRCVPDIVEPPPRWNLLDMLFWCCCAWGGASVMRRHAVECEMACRPRIMASTIRLRLPRVPGDASSFRSVYISVLCAAREAPVYFQLRMPWTTGIPRSLCWRPMDCRPMAPSRSYRVG